MSSVPVPSAPPHDSGHDDHDPYAHAGAPLLVIGVMALTLLVGAVLARLKHYMPVPFTVLMLLFGLGVGGLMHGWPWLDKNLEPFSNLDPHLILGLFIPPLIFEGSAALKWTVLSRVLPQCLMLAVPGVIINSLFVSVFLKLVFYNDWSWYFAGLMGSMMSATDPVAVVATLRDLDADLAVTILTDGEAIMNDATSIVVFNVLLPLAAGDPTLDAQFYGLKVNLLLSGLILGIIFGHLLFMALRASRGHATVSTVFQVFGSYAAFYVAESLCLTSGVITVMVMAIYVSRKRGSLTRIDEDDGAIHAFWETLVWIANAMLFFLVGLIVARFGIPEATGFDWGALFALYPFLFLARAIMLGALLPVLNVLGVRVTWQRYVMLVHGALRGGIAIALALIVFGDSGISHANRVSALFIASGIVVLTIFVNGTTAKFVVNFLKINVQPRFAQYAVKRAEQEVLALLEVGNRQAKFDSRVQLNWPALRELTVDAFQKLRERTQVHATEDVVLAIVLRATKREIWQQRDTGLLSAGAFTIIMQYLDQCIAQNRLWFVAELRDFVVEHRPASGMIAKLCGMRDYEEEAEPDDEDGVDTRRSPALVLLEAEVIAAFNDVMDNIEHTVLFLYSRKHSIHDYTNWCERQKDECRELVNDMQHSESHGKAMINVQTKRAANRILWDARRNIDRIRNQTGLSINQTHGLMHKIYELVHHVKAKPTLELDFNFRSFLRANPLFDGCNLTDKQLSRLEALFADDAIPRGETLKLDPWHRHADTDHQMHHTAFAIGDDPCSRNRHCELRHKDNSKLSEPGSRSSGLRRRRGALAEDVDPHEPIGSEPPADFKHSATMPAFHDPFADDGPRQKTPTRGGSDHHAASDDDGAEPPSSRRRRSGISGRRRTLALGLDDDGEDSGIEGHHETVSTSRRKSVAPGALEASTRLRNRSVFGIVLMGSVAKVVNNRIRHKCFTGQYFGLLRALSGRAGSQSYIALEDSEVLCGDIDKFKEVLRDFPDMAHKVWLNIAVNMVDGILATVYPTADLPPFERLALAKRGRLILVQSSDEPIVVPAFSSAFLLHGESVDNRRGRISKRLQMKHVNPNLSARAGHLIPTEMFISYSPGSYIFMLDDVPLLEARAFVMTHIPFLDAALLQMNLGVSSFVRSLTHGQDRVNSLFRILGDMLAVFPVVAKMIDAARQVFLLSGDEERAETFKNLKAAGYFHPPVGSSPPPESCPLKKGSGNHHLKFAKSVEFAASPLVQHSGSHAFVTAEDTYDGTKDRTELTVQQSIVVQDRERAGGGLNISGAEAVNSDGEASDDSDDAGPDITDEALAELMMHAADEMRNFHEHIHKVLLQQYTSQVKVRGIVQRIAAFFRAFHRHPTDGDPSPRPIWVRMVYDFFGHATVSQMFSLGDATRALTAASATHDVALADEAEIKLTGVDTPINDALKADESVAGITHLSHRYGALDRAAARLPHAVTSCSFYNQRVPREKRKDDGASLNVSHNASGSATPSMLEGRRGRQGSFSGVSNTSLARPMPHAAAGDAGAEQRKEDAMMAAVNDFDE